MLKVFNFLGIEVNPYVLYLYKMWGFFIYNSLYHNNLEKTSIFLIYLGKIN